MQGQGETRQAAPSDLALGHEAMNTPDISVSQKQTLILIIYLFLVAFPFEASLLQ